MFVLENTKQRSRNLKAS